MMKNQELFSLLDSVIKSLEITDTQYKLANERYEAIGKWLSKGIYCLVNKKICLENGEIYPQGSIRLGLTVKPIGQNEFDVDLVFFTPDISINDIDPHELNRLIGNRLREHKKYREMLTPLKRGWRITYSDEFHLDITPSIDNQKESYCRSEFVPDRKLQDWKDSNPRDYAEKFEESSKVSPTFFPEKIFRDEASVESFPTQTYNKPLLKRYIQILKRHRDVMFYNKEHKPISIIITTLATESYLYCLKNFIYNDPIKLLYDVIKFMPKFIFICKNESKDKEKYQILNPTAIKENFAERWNEVPSKKRAFDKWRIEAMNFIEKIQEKDIGEHNLRRILSDGLGEKPVNDIFNQRIQNVSTKRKLGVIGVGASVTAVKANTFFGN